MSEYTYKYPHPAVSTDCVVFGFDGHEIKILLIERGIEPYKGMWALPGGFMDMDETAEQCAIRELKEETGLEITNIKQLGAFSSINRDPRERVVTIAFYALAKQSEVIGGDDATAAKWVSINDVPQLAFDHDYILRQAMQRIRRDIHFEPIGFGLLNDEFTIAELQRLYEAILGIHFDRRNFYKKMMQTGILQEVDEVQPKSRTQLYIDEAEAEKSTPLTKYYGERNEMKSMNIDSLFGTPKNEDTLGIRFDIKPTRCMKSSTADETELPAIIKQNQVGRPAKMFRFDKEGYEKMKNNGNFRLEF